MKTVRVSLIILVLLLMAGVAQAAVTCDVSTSGVAFGAYDPLSSQDRDSIGTVTVTCTGNPGDSVNYTISLLLGGADSFTNRKMASVTCNLAYSLYVDGARTQAWGDGTNGSTVFSDQFTLTDTSSTRDYYVYGRVPADQTATKTGAYSDTVTVVLNY